MTPHLCERRRCIKGAQGVAGNLRAMSKFL